MSSRTKVIVVTAMASIAALAVVTVFGQDVRHMFGATTGCLAGDQNVVSHAYNGNTQNYYGQKALSNFGSREGYATYYPQPSTESYAHNTPNAAATAAEDHLSTFSVDVDTASYTLARRKLLDGRLPDSDGVRVEEFLNYFSYDYPSPEGAPVAIYLDGAASPFTPGKTILRVGLKAKQVTLSERKTTHLTFLIDVSGSMYAPDRLPLAQHALDLLVDNLRDGDTVGIVTYADGVREPLPPTGLEQKQRIHEVIDSLSAGGGTAMGDGLGLAYAQAAKMLSPDSQSRVIVLSDGDANLGVTSQEGLQRIIAGHVKEGVTLSVLGFGVGNYKDDRMEALADKGNGNYYYVDSMRTAKRIFQEQIASTLDLVAKDVKVQVDFNPEAVRHYRLMGYENRAIADSQFRNDAVDAGDMGSGHQVTALYELELAPQAAGRLATVRIRAKAPRRESALEYEASIAADAVAPSMTDAPGDLRFATAVAGFAEILRHNPAAQGWTLANVEKLAASAAGDADRQELVSLVERARMLRGELLSVNE